MPTYEYRCAKCGQQFEMFQSIMDKPLTICPKEQCRQKKWGKGKVTKLISAGAGLLFKGSGFYITDYRSESYKQAATKESSSRTSGGGTGTGQSGADGKPSTSARGGSAGAAPAVSSPSTPSSSRGS